MAEAGRTDHRGVIAALEAGPHRFEFFRAIALLERAVFRERGVDAPVVRAVQRDVPPLDGVRLHSSSETRHPRGDIAAVTRESDGTFVVELAWAGLTGHGGFLPDFYTFELRRRTQAGKPALADLFGLVENRMLTLLVRAWEARRPGALFDRASVRQSLATSDAAGSDPIKRFVAALMGQIDDVGAAGEGVARPESHGLFAFAGHLANLRRPVAAVGAILSAMLEAPVEVIQFFGRWIEIPVEERAMLGGRASRLGRTSSLLGQRCWDVQSAILLRVGPVDGFQFDQLLPGGSVHARLAEVGRHIVGPDLDILVQPVLRASDVAAAGLKADRRSPTPRMFAIGRNAFAAARPAARDFDGAIFPLRGRSTGRAAATGARSPVTHEPQHSS